MLIVIYDLLKALPFIDGIGKDNVYDGWDDEEFISIQGMNKAKAFNNLEERFTSISEKR